MFFHSILPCLRPVPKRTSELCSKNFLNNENKQQYTKLTFLGKYLKFYHSLLPNHSFLKFSPSTLIVKFLAICPNLELHKNIHICLVFL